MSRKKISTTIYVTPEQDERLRLLHERTKVPVAVYIREGIDLVLRQYMHVLPGQLPLAPEGPPSALAAPASQQVPMPASEAKAAPAASPRQPERVSAGELPSERVATLSALGARPPTSKG
jgi:hypothetical protein